MTDRDKRKRRDPDNNPKDAQREAKELRPHAEPESRRDNMLEREFESTDERSLEPRERQHAPLTDPEDNTRVDRVAVVGVPPSAARGASSAPRERDYLLSPAALRNLFVGSAVAGISLVVVVLTLASSAPQGRYTPADETQYQRTLTEATETLGSAGLNEGGETARIPINEALQLVAERGLEATNASLVPPQDEQAEGAAAPAGDNPYAGDADAAAEGQALFVGQLGCAGCHGADGAGGIGPSLSDGEWIYGGSDADIFETLQNGRPNGMPAFGQQADDDTLWKVVTYVQSLSQ
jgi:mono/diheme cytochrome c family protein